MRTLFGFCLLLLLCYYAAQHSTAQHSMAKGINYGERWEREEKEKSRNEKRKTTRIYDDWGVLEYVWLILFGELETTTMTFWKRLHILEVAGHFACMDGWGFGWIVLV